MAGSNPKSMSGLRALQRSRAVRKIPIIRDNRPRNKLMSPKILGSRSRIRRHLVGREHFPFHMHFHQRKRFLLDRSMSYISAVSSQGPKGESRRSLKTFNITAQEYGIFFSGFPWQFFGCGTYRAYTTVARTDRLLPASDRLRRSIKAPVAYVAVAERRTSGLRHPAIPLHWHFVMSVPPQHTINALHNARCLWKGHYGDTKIDPYDPKRSGAHYLAKLAGGSNFEYFSKNLERLPYSGPADIYAYLQIDPYVPNHAKHMMRGETLVLRSHLEGLK